MNPNHQLSFQSSNGFSVQDTTPNLSSPSVYSAHGAVSTAFTPTHVFGGAFPDVAIVSSEKTVYYVHRRQLSCTSLNSFAGLLTNAAFSITVLEPAAVVVVVLHTIYGMSCTHHNPSLDTIEAAIEALLKYGVPLHPLATPSGPLYPMLVLHAPQHAIDAYALAGKYGLEDAAVAISAHLLDYDLFRISDELTVKMGPVYFRRLVDLHCKRARALKCIVLRPPEAHPPGAAGCTDGALIQAWAFAAAQLAWNTLPSMSTNALQSMFEKAGRDIVCDDCRMALLARVQEVCWQWSEVKRTI